MDFILLIAGLVGYDASVSRAEGALLVAVYLGFPLSDKDDSLSPNEHDRLALISRSWQHRTFVRLIRISNWLERCHHQFV